MKKIFYTLTAAALCLTACQKEIDQIQSVSAPDYPEGATVKAFFTVSIPYSNGPLELTRASEMAQIPVLDNLYIAVFGDNGGMLQQLVPATMISGELYETDVDSENYGESGIAYQVKYAAELPLSNEERNLHFIGNCPTDAMEQLDFLYEKDFMDKLSTSNGDAAYWQKVVLPNGIQANLVNGKYELTPECARLLSPIALVRNYAKLIVTSSSSDFDIESYALVNVPLHGTIAPYSSTNGFATKYMSIGDYCAGSMETNFVHDLIASGYSGYMTNDLINTDNPGESSAKTPTSPDNGLYMYERTKPTRTGEQTGLIIKLKWSNDLEEDHPNYADKGQSRYYKIEVLDTEGEYMPICRNILYTISLTHLSGSGETSFDDAYNGPFFGNVSASIETATLNEINDNVHKIVVNRMDYTTLEDNDVVDIYFRFYEDMNGSPELTAASYATPARKSVDGYNPSIESVSAVEFVNWSGGTWGHVTVTLKARPASGMLREKLRIQGQLNGSVGSLFRDIVFTVMNTQEFTSESKVTVNGTNVTVTIGLPEDLPYSLFPLHVTIEALNNNLSTTNKELPVGYGPTAFDESEYTTKNGKNAFYFIRTIQYKDYLDTSHGVYDFTTEFDCPFIRTDNTDLVVKLNEQGGYFVEKTI